jgi:hypothetical protein
MTASAAEGFSGLLEWADPIIFDRVLEAYGADNSDMKLVWRLARAHARVWRALIEGDLDAFELRRRELTQALENDEIDHDRIAEADGRVLRELLSVVIDRFHRAPRMSMSYHLALLDIARRLMSMSYHLALLDIARRLAPTVSGGLPLAA